MFGTRRLFQTAAVCGAASLYTEFKAPVSYPTWSTTHKTSTIVASFKRWAPQVVTPYVSCETYATKPAISAKEIVENFVEPAKVLETELDEILEKSSFARYILYQIRLVIRAIKLGLLFLPAALTAPLWIYFPDTGMGRLTWKYCFWAIARAGPCWIKLMQWMATRHDLFPPSVTARAAEFHQDVPPHDFKHTASLISSELGLDWKKLLPDLSESTPLVGSGCIAQVYKCQADIAEAIRRGLLTQEDAEKLREHPSRLVQGSNGGKVWIALKVQHPKVGDRIYLDVELMRLAARFVDALPRGEWLGLPDMVVQFESSMKLQTDLTVEATNIRDLDFNVRKTQKSGIIANLLRTKGDAILPQVVLASPCLLGMTMEEGQGASEWLLGANKAERKQVAALFLSTFFTMLFRDNVVHADLHPGNVLVRDSDRDAGCKDVVLLDSGLVARLSPKDRTNFIDLFSAVIQGDGRTAGRLMLERAPKQMCTDPEAFYDEVQALVASVFQNGTMQLGKVKLSEVLMRMLRLCCYHRVQTDANFVTVMLGVVIVEGWARQADPDVDILKVTSQILLLNGGL